MTILLVFLVFLKITSAPNNGEGSSTGSSNVLPYNNRLEMYHIPPGSEAARCLALFSMICNMTSFTPKPIDCAKEGLFFWPRYNTTPPDYVIEYFEKFREYLYAGQFLLPYAFCDKEGDERAKKYIYRKKENSVKECLEALIDFRADSRTINTINTDPEMSREEYIQQTREDILRYAFFETSLHEIKKKIYPDKYLRHIQNFVGVNSIMESPKVFCINKFILNNQPQKKRAFIEFL